MQLKTSWKRNRPIQQVPYTGETLGDDIVRIILMYAAEQDIAARAVCRAWLNVSNSLTPFFLNRMAALQAQNASIKEAAKKMALERASSQGDFLEMAWAVNVSAMRLTLKTPREKMIDTTTTNELALMLAEQLHYNTDDGDEEEED